MAEPSECRLPSSRAASEGGTPIAESHGQPLFADCVAAISTDEWEIVGTDGSPGLWDFLRSPDGLKTSQVTEV